MSGFVGFRARKRRRNYIVFTILIIIGLVIYFFFPSINTSKNIIIPEEKLLPEANEELSSLASRLEDLQLTVFQKNQKIKFRDDQINNLVNNLKKMKEDYKKINDKFYLLEKTYNELILDQSSTENLINVNEFNSLQDDFNNLSKLNNKNNKIINDLKNELSNIENSFSENKDSIKKFLNENNLLKRDIKSAIDKNKQLKDEIIILNKKITDKNEEIEKLKDVSHHGG